jgi:hypothetical protein
LEKGRSQMRQKRRREADSDGFPPSLGTQKIESNLDVDFKICDGYTAYSAELLRVSLLVLSGLATLWIKTTIPLPNTGVFRVEVIGSATFLVLSAFAALCHRFVAMDSMAYHVAVMRLHQRCLPARPAKGKIEARKSDLELADSEAKARNWRFKASGWLLTASAALLLLGVSFALGAMWIVRRP